MPLELDIWRKLYSRVKQRDGFQAMPRSCSNDECIWKFEDDHGVQLPDSYKAFALLFGASVVQSTFRVRVPHAGQAVALYSFDDHSGDLDRFMRATLEDEDSWILFDAFGEDVVRSSILFGDTNNGDYIAFMAIPASSEGWSVFLLGRDSKEPQIVGETFDKFLLEFVPRYLQMPATDQIEFAPWPAGE